MKKWQPVFFLLLVITLFAEENPDPFDIQAKKEHTLDQRENYFLTSTDSPITPKVNPITGEYCEEATDLVVAGSQPLSIRRFYNSSDPYDPVTPPGATTPNPFL